MTPELEASVTALSLAAARMHEKSAGEYARYLEARGEDTGVKRGLDSIYFHGRANAFREAAEDLEAAAEALAPGLLARLATRDVALAVMEDLPEPSRLRVLQGGTA